MILHLDLDCFFVSAHRINNPQYNNIPVAVGGRSNLSIFDRKKSVKKISEISGAFTSSLLSSNDNKTFEEYFVDPDGRVRGIITTSSYEARAFGVKTAMNAAEALRYCPTLKILPPNYPLYHDLSLKLRRLLEKKIPSIEQPSIDEFFGDVSGWIKDEDVVDFAHELKQQIQDELGLPISIGIAKTKWIAKLCTNHAKPFGVKLILPHEVDAFIKNIPIKAFPGIGAAYQERLKKYYIKTLGEIQERKELFYSWGKNGKQLYDRICGIDNEKISYVKSGKSIGLGRTFDPIQDREEARRRITILSRHLSFLALKDKHQPMTFSLKIQYQYGEKSKSNTRANRVFSEQYLKQEMTKLFNASDNHPHYAISQLVVTLSNFEENRRTTMDMFNYENDQKQSNVTTSLQKLRAKYGIDIIKSGGEF